MNRGRRGWVLVPEAQRRHTAAWMREWAIAERLEGLEGGVAAARGRHAAVRLPPPADTAREPAPSAGDIRLLQPALAPVGVGPVYAFVLAGWEEGLLLACPFSPFLSPATTGELLTGRAEPGVRVLCVWAAATIAHCFLADSWQVDRLPETLRVDAWDVFRHLGAGAPLPRRLHGRVGAPIADPLDPRLAHQRRVARLLEPLARRTAALLESLPADASFVRAIRSGANRCALPLAAAAEGGAAYPLLVADRRAPCPPMHPAGFARRLGPLRTDEDNRDVVQERLQLDPGAGLSPSLLPAPGDALLLVSCPEAALDRPPAIVAHGLVERNPQTLSLLAEIRGPRARLEKSLAANVVAVVVKGWESSLEK